MKKIHILVLLVMLSFTLHGVIRQSTGSGGYWSLPGTWVGNAVPSPTDDVIINGPVIVNSNYTCNNLTVNDIGSLTNLPGIYPYLQVMGTFTNYGYYYNNPESGGLDLVARADINQYGVIANRFIYAGRPDGIVDIFQYADAGPFNCQQFIADAGSQGFRMLSDLRFGDCQIDLLNKDLHMYNGSQSYTLTLHGGRLYRAALNTQGFATLSMGYGAYLDNVTGEDIILTGPALIYQNVSFQNLTLSYEGSINSSASGTYDLTIQQNLVCYGTISLDSPGDIYLRLYGDLHNYGLIAAYFVYFMGTGTQHIYHDATAAPFFSHLLGKPSAITSGQLVLLSNLRAFNTIIDMNGLDIICHSSGTPRSLNLFGGQIYRCNLVTSGFSTLFMEDGAYLFNVTAGDFILQGTVRVYFGVSFDDVVNQGNLTSHFGVNALTINGDLHNWDQIYENAGSSLRLHLKRNVFNRGNTSCSQIYFDGPGNQTLNLVGSYLFGAQNIFLISNWGNAQFLLNNVLVYQGNTYYDIVSAIPGIWRIVAGTNERTVSILESAGSPLPQPQFTNISVQDENLTVTWNEVPGAHYYILQEASDPNEVFTDYHFVWDDQPGDGVVSYHAPVVLPKRFYKVIAVDL